MLDEQALRKPGFSEGHKIKLGDRQEWVFPKPRLRLYPFRNGTGKIEVGGGQSFGEEYDELLDSLIDLDDSDVFGRVGVQFQMAAQLLCQNYDLTDRDLRKLLAMDVEDETNMERWGQINTVLQGNAPKASADGSATPSSLTESIAT